MTSSSRDSSRGELGKRLIAAGQAESPSEAAMARALLAIDEPGAAEASVSESDRSLEAQHSRGGRRLGAVAMSVAAISLAAAAAILWLRVEDTAPEAAATAEATAVVTVTPTVEPLATAEPTALASVEPTAEPTTAASATASFQVAARGPRGTGRAPTATQAKPSSSAQPAPAKAQSKCGCDPSDLMCNMRCAEAQK